MGQKEILVLGVIPECVGNVVMPSVPTEYWGYIRKNTLCWLVLLSTQHNLRSPGKRESQEGMRLVCGHLYGGLS